MRYTNILFLAATSGAMAASLENRGLRECADAIVDHGSVITDLPRLSASGVDEDDIPTITNCEIPTLTGVPGSILTSFTSGLQSWTSAHSSELAVVWSACKGEDFVGTIASLAEKYGPVCSAVSDFSRALDGTVVATTTDAVPAPTDTGTSATGSGSAATSGTGSANAAPRETGMAAIAFAAAGFAFAAIH
ncbi:hypothetical protein BDP55DRAFT_639300 [Colletotrichum godetiae]|uniref:Infection structure specific protein n=1 Tax=Colletotrichum godetiae TaxID=1209918 RepID=A0AAJ0A5C5_9PEZI|nr:uncharacterized protein BDP55DRAFT_639300 [Colletotrichum godetiae]KAK1656814.1 hypothetical protein BDP55DRAFT_639300 [Colletotrichum godetiae]